MGDDGAAALASRRGSEVGGGEEEGVGVCIDGHGAGALFGGNSLDDGKFVGRIFVNDSDVPFAVGSKGEIGARIEGVCVHALANGRSRDNFAGVGVDDRHDFVVAAGEEPPVFCVHGET